MGHELLAASTAPLTTCGLTTTAYHFVAPGPQALVGEGAITLSRRQASECKRHGAYVPAGNHLLACNGSKMAHPVTAMHCGWEWFCDAATTVAAGGGAVMAGGGAAAGASTGRLLLSGCRVFVLVARNGAFLPGGSQVRKRVPACLGAVRPAAA